MSRRRGETVARKTKSIADSAPLRRCSQTATTTTAATNGTAESRRSAISDSPTTLVVTHARSAMSSWLRSGPERMCRGPSRTYPSTIRISSFQRLWPRSASRDHSRAAPRPTYATTTAMRRGSAQACERASASVVEVVVWMCSSIPASKPVADVVSVVPSEGLGQTRPNDGPVPTASRAIFEVVVRCMPKARDRPSRRRPQGPLL